MPVPTAQEHDTPRVSLRQVATDRIRSAIFDGTLLPGEPLLDEPLQHWLGMSRKPIREALNDLEHLGLIEMVPQRYTRVARPVVGDRTFVFQTLGALVGGVVRVTIPALENGDRDGLVAALGEVLDVLPRRDAAAYGAIVWPIVTHLVELCPNPILVEIARASVGSLAYQLRMTDETDWVRWEVLDADFPVFRSAVAEGDSIAAELAVERMFRMSEPIGSSALSSGR